MAQTKTKSTASKSAKITKAPKAANCPPPTAVAPLIAPSVRYVGSTSHLSHHHVAVAAEASKHIWVAPAIAGLAIVITAAIAFTGAQADTEQRQSLRDSQLRTDVIREVRNLNLRLDVLEARVDALSGSEVE